MDDVAAVVLAAGRATRFGAEPDDSKVFASLAGRPLLAHVVDAALGSRASPRIVVTGHAAARAKTALGARAARVSLVHNVDYVAGMAGSLQAAFAVLPETTKGALVLLGDMPLVTSATLDQMIDAFARETCDAVVPVYRDRQGNPVLIGRSLFARVRALSGDQGARGILAEPGTHVVRCAVEDPGILVDIDTPAALTAALGLYRPAST